MTTVTLRGSFDLHSAPARFASLVERLSTSDTLRLDLSQITWIDSAGLASLVRLLAEAKRMGADLVLEHVSDAVRRMIRLAKLETLFPAAA